MQSNSSKGDSKPFTFLAKHSPLHKHPIAGRRIGDGKPRRSKVEVSSLAIEVAAEACNGDSRLALEYNANNRKPLLEKKGDVVD